MSFSSPRTPTCPEPYDIDAALYAEFVRLARKAQAEPFDFEDGKAARRAWDAFMAAGGMVPQPQPSILPKPLPVRP